jgi:hypothetical protein
MDWNLLRSMPTSRDVPPEYACVVPDHVFHEIATTASGDPTGFIRKFGAWAARNVSRLWFGRTKEDLINLQWKKGGRPLSMQDVVHPWRTRQLRKFAKQPSYDWPNFLKTIQGGESVDYRVKDIKQHSMLCTRIADNWQKTYPGRSLSTLEEQADLIRRPDLMKPFVNGPYAGRWRAEWTSTLATDPNRFALIRWTRFVGWYCMRRITGETYKFENNFDDATYGLLASYTGHLGTNDRGLQQAVEAIFPGIKILDQQRLVEISTRSSDDIGHVRPVGLESSTYGPGAIP